jgi:hypothetical protein
MRQDYTNSDITKDIESAEICESLLKEFSARLEQKSYF